MNRLASVALASAIFAATGGIAVAATAPTGAASPAHPATATAASAGSTASGATVPPGTPGREDSRREARMTHALNLLEAKGYADFHDFKPDGKNFDATVTRADKHKQMSVKIDPDNDQVTVQG